MSRLYIVTMKLNISIALVIFGVTLSAASQNTVPETDFQVWNETTFSLPVMKSKDDKGKSIDRLSLLLITSLRLGQNRLAFADERIGGGFDLVLNKNFNFSPTYLYIAAQPGRGRREFEHRLRFDLGFSHKFKHFSIKDRNRVEYRVRHSRADSVRYRNKFTFSVPINRDGKELFTPFISDEPYYDFGAKQWSRNELSPGISKKFSDKLSAEFFYLWRHNRSGLPRDVHAVGVNLKVKLK
jgi:hypothetical protein